jgi:hypothetical protein
MPRHQATPIRRATGCLWAMAGSYDGVPGCRLSVPSFAVSVDFGAHHVAIPLLRRADGGMMRAWAELAIDQRHLICSPRRCRHPYTRPRPH